MVAVSLKKYQICLLYTSDAADDAVRVDLGGRRIIKNHLACDNDCLLYTSDAADEEDSVDLGGRRIIKKKN
ncbi:hypothetical protein JMUB7513_27740 [Staphylococcus aureus]